VSAELRAAAARVLEPFLEGVFNRQGRAARVAESLFWAGLLRDGLPLANARERVVDSLQRRIDWPYTAGAAERAAEALERAGLLTTTTEED
jgi:hypothetical protein